MRSSCDSSPLIVQAHLPRPLQEVDVALNQKGGPGQVKPLVRRLTSRIGGRVGLSDQRSARSPDRISSPRAVPPIPLERVSPKAIAAKAATPTNSGTQRRSQSTARDSPYRRGDE